MEFAIRPAQPKDYAYLPEIEAAADAVLALAGLPEASSAEDYRQAHFVLVAEQNSEQNSELLGFARMDEIDNQAHLEQISVLPEASRQGIGRALLEAGKAWARAAGYQQMTLCTFRDVPFNAPFYARCGFAVVENPVGDLLGLRAHERELGLDDVGARVVMVSELLGNSS